MCQVRQGDPHWKRAHFGAAVAGSAAGLAGLVGQLSDELQERSCGKREQRRGPLVAASEAGLSAVWIAGACRVDADRGARHGSADLPEREWPVDGGVDRELR